MRFKGLGEMQPEELAAHDADPATRRLLRVNIDNVEETDRILTELMGKDVVLPFQIHHGWAAQADLDLRQPLFCDLGSRIAGRRV